MKIQAGFTERVKEQVGGARGCTHLVALLLAMAPAAVQGAWSAVARQPLDPATYSGTALRFLENTCWVWRADGDLMKETGLNWQEKRKTNYRTERNQCGKPAPHWPGRKLYRCRVSGFRCQNLLFLTPEH